MNQQSDKSKRREEATEPEIMDEMNNPEITDEMLDRVSGGGNSAWGTKQGNGGSS
jgi:hypothetical protein